MHVCVVSFQMQSAPFLQVDFLKIYAKYILKQVENSHKSPKLNTVEVYQSEIQMSKNHMDDSRLQLDIKTEEKEDISIYSEHQAFTCTLWCM